MNHLVFRFILINNIFLHLRLLHLVILINRLLLLHVIKKNKLLNYLVFYVINDLVLLHLAILKNDLVQLYQCFQIS